MRTRRPLRCAIPLLLVAFATVALAACGDAPRRAAADPAMISPQLHVVDQATVCDPGKHSYCGTDLVLLGPSPVISSYALRAMESTTVAATNWKRVTGQAKRQLAAASPNGDVYLSYATAHDDLAAMDQGFVQRPRGIVRTLRYYLHRHRAALSITFSPGP